MRRFWMIVFAVTAVSVFACIQAAPENDAVVSGPLDAIVVPGDACTTSGTIEICPFVCWSFGLRSCLRYPDGLLRWTPCTPAEAYGARFVCDAGTPPPSDAVPIPSPDGGTDPQGGTLCLIDFQVRPCIGSTTCTPIAQWCDAVSHQWTSCTLLPQPDACRPDSGQSDIGTQDMTFETGTLDVAQADHAITDARSSDTGTDLGNDTSALTDAGTDGETDTAASDAGTDSASADIVPPNDAATDGSDVAADAASAPCCSGAGCGTIILCTTRCGLLGFMSVGEACVGGICHPISPSSETCGATDAGTDAASSSIDRSAMTDVAADASVADAMPETADASDVTDVGIADAVADVFADIGFAETTVSDAGDAGASDVGMEAGLTDVMGESAVDVAADTQTVTDVTAEVTRETGTDAMADADVAATDAAPSGDAITDAMADRAQTDVSADADITDGQTVLPDVPSDADFASIAYVATNDPILDPTCGGAPLATWPLVCPTTISGMECWHICHLAAAWIVSADPSRTVQNSRSPNAFIRPTSMRFIQTEDPLSPMELGTASAPTTGRGLWEASAYASIHNGFAPMFNIQDRLPRQAFGPDAFIWAVGQIALQEGISRNGNTRLYRVNRDLTQTLVIAWEMVANNPINAGSVTAFQNGGNAHPIAYLCPPYLAARIAGSYRCNDSTTDEPAFSGSPILN